MSAIGQIMDAVEALLAPLRRHEKEQDRRLDALEQAVTKLTDPTAKKAPAAPAAKTARAGTATAKGQSQP